VIVIGAAAAEARALAPFTGAWENSFDKERTGGAAFSLPPEAIR
jgi:hypothetical protein